MQDIVGRALVRHVQSVQVHTMRKLCMISDCIAKTRAEADMHIICHVHCTLIQHTMFSTASAVHVPYPPFTQRFVFPSLHLLAFFSPVFAPQYPLCFPSPIGLSPLLQSCLSLLCLLFVASSKPSGSLCCCSLPYHGDPQPQSVPLLCCSLCCWSEGSDVICCL